MGSEATQCTLGFLDFIQSDNRNKILQNDILVGSHCANRVLSEKFKASSTREVANGGILRAKNPRTTQARTGEARKYLAD